MERLPELPPGFVYATMICRTRQGVVRRLLVVTSEFPHRR
jgi:hypothetical protein